MATRLPFLGLALFVSCSRVWRGDITALLDISAGTLLELWLHGNTIISEFQKTSINSYIVISLLCCLPLLALLFWVLVQSTTAETNGFRPPVRGSLHRKFPDRPCFYPCRTSHSRFFPKKHTFSYSYLFVGVPIGWRGRLGPSLSVDNDTERSLYSPMGKRYTWFSVKSQDYLDRGESGVGLEGKLRMYLETQGEDLQKYPYAYLVTAPRFLGYQFNPVSFWYLYSQEGSLDAMILEVNNTFGERRPYFLKCGQTQSGRLDVDTTPTSRSSELADSKFKTSWRKDFHVSPFNSRKGAYSLDASDPLTKSASGDIRLSNSITLKSSKGNLKLIARVSSTEQSIDPQELGGLTLFDFLLQWWWVGFMTFPRIVKEAGRLFFQKQLHVWYRPEVKPESLGRIADANERVLEQCFRRYIQRQVADYPTPLVLKYTGAANIPHVETFTSRSSIGVEHDNTVDFHVSTPLFYSQFVRFAHPVEALSDAILRTEEPAKTIWVTNPQHIPIIFARHPRTGENAQHAFYSRYPLIDRMRWTMLQTLRNSCRPSSSTEISNNFHDIRLLRSSPLDEFVAINCDAHGRYLYRKALWNVYIGSKIAFETGLILRLYDYVLRFILIYVGLATVSSHNLPMHGQFGSYLLKICMSNLVNVWGALKYSV